MQEAVKLLTELASSRDRSGKVLPKSNAHLQTQIELIKKLSDDREMSLNDDKTCLFIVNFTENHQFQPLLQIPDCSEPLDVVLETKLLGYWLTKDMKTNRHVEYMLEICYKRLWAIIKLKKAGISNEDILHFFFMKIRSVLESNCPVFHSMLTEENSDDIERLQKIVLRVILTDKYSSYEQACSLLNVQTLKKRRKELCLKFSLKILKNDKFKDFFQLNQNINNVRSQEKFTVPFAHTSRYQNSPKVYLTNLLNEYFTNNET